jgi:hypothetical protein
MTYRFLGFVPAPPGDARAELVVFELPPSKDVAAPGYVDLVVPAGPKPVTTAEETR